MSNLKRNGQLRWSPSYLRNRGQMTRGQKRALREWWPLYGISFRHDEVIKLDEHFNQNGPLVIEIGFGAGDHLVSLAEALPDHRILGIEVHRPSLAATTQKIHNAGITNTRLIRGDARLILTDHLADRIADAFIIQFPDPWPKAGDAHRRLIQPSMVEVLSERLLPDGELIVITDVAAYAAHTSEIMSSLKSWTPTSCSKFNEHRIKTNYEKKALASSRQISELSFQLKP